MSILPKSPRPRLLQMSNSRKMNGRRLKAFPGEYSRISSDCRDFVFQRDRGRCGHCGSGENLQFDHIIPKSKGGSGAALNVELLCGTCNNSKKARVYVPKIPGH